MAVATVRPGFCAGRPGTINYGWHFGAYKKTSLLLVWPLCAGCILPACLPACLATASTEVRVECILQVKTCHLHIWLVWRLLIIIVRSNNWLEFKWGFFCSSKSDAPKFKARIQATTMTPFFFYFRW
jgi:hypothetical protein